MRLLAPFLRPASLLAALLCVVPAVRTGGQQPAVTQIDLSSAHDVYINGWKFHSGDDLEWAKPGFDDGAWRRISEDEARRVGGPGWLRAALALGGTIDDTEVLALHFDRWAIPFQVFWDGDLIATSGTTNAAGRPGAPAPRLGILRVGRERTQPGSHVLALRLAPGIQPGEPCCSMVWVGPYTVLRNSLQASLDSSRINVGLYLAAVLFSLFFYLGGWRSPSLLFFSGYAVFPLTYALWNIAELSGATPASLPLLPSWLAAVGTLVSSWLLILFLLWHLDASRKVVNASVPAIGVLVATIGGYTSGRPLVILEALLFIYGLGICLAGRRRGTPGATFAMVGVGTMVVFQGAELSHVMAILCSKVPSIPWPAVFTGFFLACVLGSISFRIRERARALQALQTRSQRLETELLKKSIQPHFVMNTLFSIKSLIVRNPPKAEELVEAMAAEFRIISRIAPERAIDVEEEIDLCQRHLQLMGYRRDATYRLIVEGLCPGERVPPMVFHTLVENGLTHSYQPKENGTFYLTCERTEREIVYRLRNDGSRITHLTSLAADAIEEGMGLKYVKARLEESAPGQWRLDYGVKDGLWEVTIALASRASPCAC